MIYITHAQMWVYDDHKLHLHGTWTAYLSIATEFILVFICFLVEIVLHNLYFMCGVLSSVVCLFVFAAIVFSLFDWWIYESPLWYLQAFAESILHCRPINAKCYICEYDWYNSSRCILRFTKSIFCTNPTWTRQNIENEICHCVSLSWCLRI